MNLLAILIFHLCIVMETPTHQVVTLDLGHVKGEAECNALMISEMNDLDVDPGPGRPEVLRAYCAPDGEHA